LSEVKKTFTFIYQQNLFIRVNDMQMLASLTETIFVSEVLWCGAK